MPTRNIVRQATNPLAAPGLPNVAPIYVDSDDNILKMIPAGSGTTEVQIADVSSTQTFTNKTLTSPTITGSTLTTATLTSPTITAPTITGAGSIATGFTFSANSIWGDYKALAADAAFTSNGTLATLTGFSWTLTAGGTYVFEVNLPATMTTNGGLAVAFTYTTATAASIQMQTLAATASDNTTAVSTQSTTTASATKYFDSKTAAYTLVTLKGSLIVGTGGTVAVQVAQNASHVDTTTVLKGAYARFTRVL